MRTEIFLSECMIICTPTSCLLPWRVEEHLAVKEKDIENYGFPLLIFSQSHFVKTFRRCRKTTFKDFSFFDDYISLSHILIYSYTTKLILDWSKIVINLFWLRSLFLIVIKVLGVHTGFFHEGRTICTLTPYFLSTPLEIEHLVIKGKDLVKILGSHH